MAYLFQKLAQGRSKNPMADIRFMKAGTNLTAGSRDTREWFRAKAKGIGALNPKVVLAQGNNVVPKFNSLNIGKMYMYLYDPKTKDELPYWDKFPLIFVIDVYKDGFLGLNLHYLPPKWRAKLMDALYSTINNDRYDSTTRLRISYDILRKSSRMRMFAPCIKRYLYSHVRSNLVEVDVNDWDYACMLPLERFENDSLQTVYTHSVAKFRK